MIISAAIFVFQPSPATTILINTTEACKKIGGEGLFVGELEIEITTVSRGAVKFDVKRIWLNGTVNGLLLKSNGREIIHCTEWMTMPEFVASATSPTTFPAAITKSDVVSIVLSMMLVFGSIFQCP